MNDTEVVTRSVSGGVAWLQLRRPEVLNALNAQVIDGLDSQLARLEKDRACRVVVLTGTGRAFSAGADLKSMLDGDGNVDPTAIVAFVKRASHTVQRLADLPQPVIAAVNGIAVAGGLELALACDLVVAADDAVLGDAHANYGLLPGAGGAARLPRVVGPRLAKYLLFTGEILPAQALVASGLVNEVVPAADLNRRVQELAEQIASKSPSVLVAMKRLVDDGLQHSEKDALSMEIDALARQVETSDFLEGLSAFREKRPPRFVGA
jgi:enoyl-CoA hydratase/carnithine racemase